MRDYSALFDLYPFTLRRLHFVGFVPFPLAYLQRHWALGEVIDCRAH